MDLEDLFEINDLIELLPVDCLKFGRIIFYNSSGLTGGNRNLL